MGKKGVAEQKEEVLESAGGPSTKKKSRRKIMRLPSSRIYISASYNNTSISVTDSDGNVIVWSSAGAMGFKGPRKSTPFAASKVVENIFEKLGGVDIGRVAIYVRGVGSGRDAAVRAITGRGINVASIKDKTPIPHNGCRARKARRV